MGVSDRPRVRTEVLVITVLALAAVHWGVSRQHIVNADEGFYLAAGRDVAAGLRPYADFFYPQMPYLPYAEAALFGVTGVSLKAARLLSVVPAGLLAVLLAIVAARRTGDTAAACFVVFAYMGHALSVNYLTVLKTYGLANLFFVCALLLVTAGPSALRHAAGGMCAAIAVGMRLPVAAAVVVLFVWSAKEGARPALAFAAGAVAASLPVLLIAAQDPQAFWFGNVGFHELRRELIGAGPILMQKLGVLMKWLFLPQNLIVWCLGIAGWWRGGPRERCALLCAAALGGIYLYATPTYLEYMVQLIPVLLIAALPATAGLFTRRRLGLAVGAVYALSLLIALRPAGAESKRALKNELWNLAAVESVAAYLRGRSGPDDRILSWWEGYPVLAGRPGFNEVGFWHSNVARKVPEQLRDRFHVASPAEVGKLIEGDAPPLIVCAEGVWPELRPLIDARYERAQTFGRVEVFARRERSGRHESRGS